jgi:pimeloyl-ACP methyl ester carboxylesterase
MNKQRRQLILSGAALFGAHLAGCVTRDTGVGKSTDTLDAARFTALRRFVALREGDVAYVDYGSGRAVLMLHGFPLNSFQWRGAIERLAPYARCIAPDFLGMGESRAAQGKEVGPDAQVNMLVSLLDVLGIPSADVIANDSGCAVAQLLMVRHPTRVRSMLLTNGDTELQCPPPDMRPVIELARRRRFVDEWLAPWHADPQLARSEQGIGGLCYTDRAHPTDEALRMYFGAAIASGERKLALENYAMALERNALAGISSDLRASRVPVRIVWGMGDTIFDSASADYLDRSLKTSHGVRRLPGAKLFWPEERPDLVAAQARLLWRYAMS